MIYCIQCHAEAPDIVAHYRAKHKNIWLQYLCKDATFKKVREYEQSN